MDSKMLRTMIVGIIAILMDLIGINLDFVIVFLLSIIAIEVVELNER